MPRADRARLALVAFEERLAPASLAAAVADFDGDGVPDLAVGRRDGRVAICSGATGATLLDFRPFDGGYLGPVAVAAADFTGSGRAEPVVGAGLGDGRAGRIPRPRHRAERDRRPGGDDAVDSTRAPAAAGIAAPAAGNFAADLAGFSRTGLNGTDVGRGTVTVADGVATFVEGDSFRVGLGEAFAVPATATAVTVTFDAPAFDASSVGRVKDAFEVAVLRADGSPLALPTAAGRAAAFNWTERVDHNDGLRRRGRHGQPERDTGRDAGVARVAARQRRRRRAH